MSFTNYLKLLSEYVSFKSISTDPAYKDDILSTVKWLQTLLASNGFTVKTLQGNTGNPVVFAEYFTDPKYKTVLVYGHYDVQPAKIEDGWYEEPFSLLEKDERLYARGIVDNKGQNLIHIYTVINLIKQNKLKYNVKFLIEGDEETGGGDLSNLILENKNKLNADLVMISDGEITGTNPVIEYSLRGGVNCTITYRTLKNNLHSGIYGGVAPNAAHELCKLLSKIYDGPKIAIKGFYDDVNKVTQELLHINKIGAPSKQSILEQIGAQDFVEEGGYDFFTQTGLRPTIQVTGIESGYYGDGYANIVPAVSRAKINFRFVASQDPKKMISLFKEFVKENTPKYVSYTLEFTSAYEPVSVDISSKEVQEVEKLLSDAFGEIVIKKPVGGGIPVVSDFKNVLGREALLVSLGNEDCNMHGVNENFSVKILKNGLKFSESFFKKSS